MIDTLRKRVLIVDDDPRNGKLLMVLLGAEGYAVRSCASGAAALLAIEEERPDVILLDIMMPGMDGFEVVRRLKADPALRAIPLFVVSALDDAASRQRLARAGVNDILIKPIDRWELKVRLAALLGEREDKP